MSLKDVRITLRERQTTGGLLPVDSQFGEPFINLYDGVLKFSGVTGGSFETNTQGGVFEVGSVLYNQRISNRLNINNNFLISGDTGIISTYGGLNGASLNGKFLSGTTEGLVLANISDIQGTQVYVQSGRNIITGGTFELPIINLVDSPSVNNITFSGVSIGGSSIATNVSATTIYSGSSNLEGIIYNIANSTSGVHTYVQSGTNIITGGTANAPTVNLTASPSVNNITFSGTAIGGTIQAGAVTATSMSASTLSGGTILSGGTNLYSIFSQTDTDTITRVQPGTNITTGGTANAPTINLTASPTVNNITFSGTAIGGTIQAGAVTATSMSAATLSGGTILSGGTNLYSIFSQTDTITRVQPGTNITTGGTANAPTVNLTASPIVNNITFSGTAIGGTIQAGAVTATSMSAATLSGGTILSGGTNLYSIFSQTDTITRVQPGTNITTGGTANAPIINIIASPSFNDIIASGTTSGNIGNFSTLSATAITDSNLSSGYAVYAGVGGLLKTNTGFTFDDNSSTLFSQNLHVGSPSLSGSVTIWGDVTLMGAAISAFTSELYIEDNNIELNYNPTANTISTSLGAGLTIQDGSGVASSDVFFDIRGASTGVANRSFSTNLQDLRIRETGTINSPDGSRVLAENDFLDAGFY